MGWYLEALTKYATFSGRARRSEFWWFTLINVVIIFVLALIDAGAATGGAFLLIYAFGVLVPSIAVSVRRLHDIGRSGWWLLISLIPFGNLVLLFFYFMPGTTGDNAYGPDPKSTVPPRGPAAVKRDSLLEEELMRLYELYKSGAMPAEEYEMRRRQVFARR